jgi:hypothetical protein
MNATLHQVQMYGADEALRMWPRLPWGVDVGLQDGAGAVRWARARDLSATGCALLLQGPPGPDPLCLLLPVDDAAPLQVPCTVRRVEALDDGTWLVGLAFTWPDEA